MLFMKGTPTAPVCGFSLRVVNILKHLGMLSEEVELKVVTLPVRIS